MTEPTQRLVSKRGMVIDLILSGAWFAFFSVALKDYVPSYTEPYVTFFALSTAGCLTGIFWLVISMFRVVLADERIRNQK